MTLTRPPKPALASDASAPATESEAPSSARSQLRGMAYADQVAALSPLQRKATGGPASAMPAPAPIGGGRPMPAAVQAKMEAQLGADFSAVRIHEGAQATAVGAQAYTQGADIHFAPGAYQPESTRGQELLGHELTHVVQQSQGKVAATTDVAGVAVNDDPSLERAADEAGAKAARGEAASATAAPVVASASAGPVQRKGVQDGDIWAQARQLALRPNGSLNDPLARILVAVMQRGRTALEVQNALVVGAQLFDTVDRADAIVRHHAAGLTQQSIVRDATSCPGPDLDAVLALSLAAQNVGLDAYVLTIGLRRHLLTNGRGAPAIVAALQLYPQLLDSLATAPTLVDHAAAGGTRTDADRALQYARGSALRLTEALATLRALTVAPQAAGLAQDKLAAVLDERAHLTSDALRINAVALADAATDGQDAALKLQRSRDFGYLDDLRKHAEDEGDQAAQTLVTRRLQEVQDSADLDRRQALTDQNQAAWDALNNRPKKVLGSLNGALSSGKDAISKVREARSKFEDERNKLAKPDIDDINLRETQERNSVVNQEGPAKKQEVVDAHKQFAQSVGHHPDALAALNAAGQDMALGRLIIQAITAAPNTRTLLLQSGLDTTKLQRAVTIPALTLGAMLTAGVQPAALSEYCASDDRLALVNALHAAGVAGGRINDLATRLGTLNAHVANGTARGHLVTLCGVYTPAEIVAAVAAAPNPANTKMALLVALQPHAASAAALTHVLAVCTGFGWSQADISNCLTALPNGSSQNAMLAAVHAQHLTRFNKLTHFSSWLGAIADLIGAGYVTIAPLGGWVRLNGQMTTDERAYEVQLMNGTQMDTFVVHFHPHAINANVNNPNASRSHFKPQRGGNVRYGYAQGPGAIRNLTESRP